MAALRTPWVWYCHLAVTRASEAAGTPRGNVHWPVYCTWPQPSGPMLGTFCWSA